MKQTNLDFTGDLLALQGLKLGAVRNYSYGKAFDTVADRLNVLRFETGKALIKSLTGRRCDVIIGNEVVIKTLAGRIHDTARIKSVGPKLTDDPLYIGFSRARGHKALAGQFSRALKVVKDSLDYKKILKTYGL